MEDISIRFGNQLRILRLDQKLTQEELAEKAGLDLTTIREIESSLRNLSTRTLHKVALKIHLNNLFS